MTTSEPKYRVELTKLECLTISTLLELVAITQIVNGRLSQDEIHGLKRKFSKKTAKKGAKI